MGFTGLSDDTVAAMRKGELCHSVYSFTSDNSDRHCHFSHEIITINLICMCGLELLCIYLFICPFRPLEDDQE